MSQSPDKPLSGMGDGELYQTLITLQHRCGYILKMCKDTREMRMEAEEMLRLLRGIKLLAAAPSATAQPFNATHRHAEGGLYMLLDHKIDVHDRGLWVPGVRYRNEAGREFVRTWEEWRKRFTVLPEGEYVSLGGKDG